MKKTLLVTLVVFWAFSHHPAAVLAQSSWTGPGSDFNTGSNWSSGVPTNDNAIFNSTLPTNISLSASVSVATFTFNPGASAYTFTVPNAVNLAFPGTMNINAVDGIINNSANSPTLAVNKGGALTFTGGATAGNAVIQNSGTLTFSAVNTGFFEVSATAANASITNSGLLIISGLATAGNATIVNVSTIQIIMDSSSASGTLGNATVVNNGLIDASGGQLFTGWTVGSIEGSGNILLGPQPFSIGSNNLSTAITGNISGPGTLTKVGLGTLTLAGTNTYTGLTTITSGELSVMGSLVSDVQVSSSGTLSGTGRVGQISNGGTVSPGSGGAGQLTAAAYSGNGSLNILINGSSTPSLNVLGTADITGGTMTVTGSRFAVGQYSVLESHVLTGTFATVNGPGSLYLVAPIYTPTDVYLQISFATPFSVLAQTANQRGLAANLEEFKATTTPEYTQAISSLAQLPAAQMSHAFDQISGDSLASFQEVNLQNATVFSKGMRQRTVNVSSGSYGLWAQGMGWTESTDGNSFMGSPATDATTGGFQAGYDYALAEGLVVGISGGYGQTSLDVTDRDSSGDTTSIQSGLYAGYAWNGWLTSAGTALTSSSNQMTRTIQYGPFDGNATSSFASRLLSTFLETGYTFAPQKSLTVSPSLSLMHTYLTQDAFSESGGSGLDLNVANRSFNSFTSSLGTGIKYSFGGNSSNRGAIALTAAWEHEWGENEDSLSVRFADTDGGGNYTVQATPRDQNAAAIGLHGEVPLKGNLALFANYTATLASEQTIQSFFGGAHA